jgi:uncharacterized membrane protein YidH (DUF202 family)
VSNPIDRPFDVGLQAERTALAWQRTTLSFGVATLVAARLTANVFGMASFVVAAAGVVLMVTGLFVSHRRYRLIHTRLTEATSARVPLASAVPLVLYALAAFALGFVGLVIAIAGP